MARQLPRASAGNKRRQHGKRKNRYDKWFRRADWDVQPSSSAPAAVTVAMGRTNSTSTKPQAPKGGKGKPAPSVPNPKKPR